MEKNTTLVTKKNEIEYADESKTLAQLEHSNYQDSEIKTRMNYYPIEHHLKSFKLLIETLHEENMTVVTGKIKFEFQN